MVRAAASSPRKPDTTSHKLTDYFPKRSQGSSVSTSQPSSSQPTPSQVTKSSLTPTSSQQPPPSQTPSQPRLKLKPVEQPTRDKKRKAKAAPRPDQEVISLSSTSEKDLVILDDSHSHISLSSGSGYTPADAIIVVSDCGSVHEEPQPPSSVSTGMRTRLKSTKTTMNASESISTAVAKPNQAPRLSNIVPTSTPAASSAKTTVKRRGTNAPNTSSGAPPIFPAKKRKSRLEDFDSPSEDSADGSVYIPRPDKVGAALSTAPEILNREDLIPLKDSGRRNVTAPPPSSPLSHLDEHPEFPNSPSVASKRRRLSPPEPNSRLELDPLPMDVPREDAAAFSGNEADEEEVPSSQSDEQELTLPKTVLKDPKEIQARVDEWRRTSRADAHPTRDVIDESPISEVAVMPSDGEATLSSGMGVGAQNPADDDEVLSYVDYVPPDSHTNAEDDHMDLDFDVGYASVPNLEEAPPEEAHMDSTQEQGHGSEAEVNQQLQILPQSSSATSVSTLSSRDIVDQLSPVTPHQETASLPAIASSSDSPLKSTSNKPFSEIFSSGMSPRPSTPTALDAVLADLPPTPVKIDSKTKTLNIIEQIKAQAKAKVAQEEEENKQKESDEMKFDWEESDSDSELDFKYDFSKRNQAPAAKPLSSASDASTASSSRSAEVGASRYNFRRRSSPSSRQSPPELSTAVLKPKPQANPLAAMLREKKRDDKRGVGMHARREAEAILAGEEARRARVGGKQETMDTGKDKTKLKGKGRMRDEMDEEDTWNDRTLEEFDSQDGEGGSEEENAEDAVGLLGAEDGGEAVRKILKDDKEQAAETTVEKGVRLFEEITEEDERDAMEVDSQVDLFKLPFSGKELDADPVLSLLRVAVNTRDVVRLCTYLTPTLITRVQPDFVNTLVTWLFHLALSFKEQLLSQRAVECLFATARRSLPTSQFSQLMLSTALRFGARDGALASLGSPLPTAEASNRIPEEKRNMLLVRALSIVKLFAQYNAISLDDVPSLILSLLPIAMDPSSSAELQTSIVVTIDILGGSIPSTSNGYAPLEPEICSRVLAYAADFTPANKAYLLSLFCGGSPQMARIARWLARRMILTEKSSTELYSAHLPLEPLITHLSPSTGSKAMFDILGHAETPEYFDELAAHLEILNVFFNDIDGHVQLEEKAGAQVLGAMMSPGREKPLTELERVRKALDRLHGRIVDTHTINLARTRAKAALQQLSIRMHYTHVSAKGRLRTRPNGLKTWLKPVQR